LMQAVAERVVDQSVLKLLRAMLRAGVMESGFVRHPDTGTPQGGVVSPLLCNVYLHRLDRAWDTRTVGVLVRFADDLLVVCKSRQQAQAALARLRALLAELGLAPKEAKTRIVELAVGGEGFDFLGFHHRMVRSRGVHGRRGVEFLARWPSDRAMRRARDRIAQLTIRSRLLLPVEVVVEDLNRFLRGWANYYRYGHSTIRFALIQQHARDRLAVFIGRRHKRGRGFGWSVIAYKSADYCGLLRLIGTVIAPRANKPWREKPNAGGERRR
jgi:group II intron reverse transcriptase/maturase